MYRGIIESINQCLTTCRYRDGKQLRSCSWRDQGRVLEQMSKDPMSYALFRLIPIIIKLSWDWTYLSLIRLRLSALINPKSPVWITAVASCSRINRFNSWSARWWGSASFLLLNTTWPYKSELTISSYISNTQYPSCLSSQYDSRWKWWIFVMRGNQAVHLGCRCHAGCITTNSSCSSCMGIQKILYESRCNNSVEAYIRLVKKLGQKELQSCSKFPR